MNKSVDPNFLNPGRGTSLVPVSHYSMAPPYGYTHGGEQATSPAEAAFDFWKTLQVLSRRRWLILAVIVCGLAIAATQTLREIPLYRAATTIEIQRKETQIIAGAEVGPVEIADAEHMATQYALLKSRALAERVAETLDLPADRRYANPASSREARLSQAVSRIINGLSVEPVARSRIVKITFVSPYPGEASRLADAVAENFIESTIERKINTTAYARTFLEDRLKSTKEALETSERKLVEYAQNYGILDLGAGDAAQVSDSLDAASLRALSAALTEAQNARISAEQRSIEAQNNTATLQTLTSPAIMDLRARRSALQAEYQQKLATFKPEFPEMVELQARMAALDREMLQERTNIVSALQADFQAARAREASLRQRVIELSGSLQGERGDRIEYNILRRDVDTNRAQYEALLQRLKEVSISGDVTTSQVAIVDRAQTPVAPFSPNIGSALLRALMMSVAVAIAIAFLLEYVDDTVKSPQDVASKMGLPCLGVVPKVTGDRNVMDHMRDPKSRVSEAFLSTRTAIQFTTADGAPRSILVTGTKASEGKTSATLGLALSFASAGMRVLIIDADMRRPSFAAPLKAPSIGLSRLLTSQEPLVEHLVKSSSPNLFLLPSGRVPPNPAELLSSPRLRVLIAEAEELFDVVIVDSAPVMNFADAPLLSAACEATVVVIQSGGTRRPAASSAVVRLLVSRANIIGALLTKYDTKQDAYGYGYGAKYAADVEDDDDRPRRRRSRSSAGDGTRSIQVFADAEIADLSPPPAS